MLEVAPRFGTRRYDVRRQGDRVAELALGWFREGGELVVAGVPHRVRREGLASGAFRLLRDGAALAEARKPSAFTNRFVVEHGARRFELVKATWWGRRFELREHDRVLGSIAPAHPLTRRCTVDLPDDLDVAVQVFLAALVLLMWEREATAAAGGGGGGG